MTELAEARLSSDLETVRIAEYYSSHPLLKHMPVPRFKLPEINIDASVLVDEENNDISSKEPEELIGRAVPPTEKERVALLENALGFAGISLKKESQVAFMKLLDKEVTRIWNAPPQLLSANRVSGDISKTMTSNLDDFSEIEDIKGAQRKGFSESIRTGLQSILIAKQKKQLDGLSITVDTNRLQRLEKPDLAMNLRLSISEESYEITIGEDDDGNTIQYFSPE